mgnify:CR=1 FL=1
MRAGFARSDITPRLGVQLAGYGPFYNRHARGIHTPIFARAAALATAGKRALLISVESCGLPRELSERIRRLVTERTGVPDAGVFLTATHTHSAPAVGSMFGWGEADPFYVETLPGRIAAAAETACAALTPVTWSVGTADCEGFALNREVDGGQGFAAGFDYARQLAPAWRPAHPELTDPRCRVLVARAGKKIVGLIHHFACHPVVCGEQTHLVHGDYPGIASAAWEMKHPGGIALFLPGAFGDINPAITHCDERRSLRALRILGHRYAAAITRASRAAEPLPETDLAWFRAPTIFPRRPRTRAYLEREIAQIEKRLAAPGTTDDPRAQDVASNTSLPALAVRLGGLRQVLAGFDGDTAPNPAINLQGLRIGDVLLLGSGLELYHAVGQAITAGLPGREPWVVSLAGGIGYAADHSAGALADYAADFVPLIIGETPFRHIARDLPKALRRHARALQRA